MWKEFKAFAMKGSVMDMAIGIIIGAAFGQIVTSLVTDIIMPPLGLAMGHIDFNDFYLDLTPSKLHLTAAQPHASLAQAKAAGAVVVAYGHLINTVIDFLIVAFAMFLVVRWFSTLKKPEPPAAPTSKDCPYCASSIPIKAVRCPNCTSQLQPA
jgi:large conductance mechanosensitive channel